MQRTLTCFGLLFLIALGGPSEGFSQDGNNRKTLRSPAQDKSQASTGQKSSGGGFWSSTSKWRQRLLPFTVEKEPSKADGQPSAVRNAARQNLARPNAQRKPTKRHAGEVQKQIGSPPPDARDLVTMPAMSVPPTAPRPTNQRMDQAKETRQEKNPTATRTLPVAQSDNPARVAPRPVVSRKFVPSRDIQQPVATADLREGKSSRRQNRFGQVDKKEPADVVNPVASKRSQERDGKSPSRRVSAVGPSPRVEATSVSGEVRVSDRPADRRSSGPVASARGPFGQSASTQGGAATARKAQQTQGPKASASQGPSRGVDKTLQSKAKSVNPSPPRGDGSGRDAVSRTVASQRQVPRTSAVSPKNSKVNPLLGDRLKESSRKQTSVENRVLKAPAEERPTRVSARLTSQTVGTELGGSLLFSKSPQLSLETLGPSQVVIGKEATFKIRLQNLGDPVAESVLVQVNTPLGAQIVAAQASRGQTNSLATAKQRPLEWRLDRLDAHGTEFLTLRIVPRKSDSFDLGVTWTVAPIASQTRIKVQEPKLNLEINGPHEIQYGDTKIYRLTITNPGNGIAENVQLKLTPLDGSSRPMAVRNIGSMEPGAKQVMEVELTARQVGYLNVEALAIADSDLKTEARQRVLVRRAQLEIAAKGPEMNYAGTAATYRFRIDNQGNSSAENIRVIATLPTGGDYLDSSDEGDWDPESRQVSWNVPALVAQNKQNFEVRVSLSHPGENIFQVRLSADDDLAANSEVKTRVEALADLQLVINDPRGPVPVEEETTYEVLITNRGTKAAEMVDVVVFFSEGIEPISVSGGRAKVDTGQVIFHPIELIAPGEEVVYKIAARANRSGNHVFRTEVACEVADVRLVAEESTRFYGSSSVHKESRKDTVPVPLSTDAEASGAGKDDLPEYRQKKS
jgi:hypothetical protein